VLCSVKPLSAWHINKAFSITNNDNDDDNKNDDDKDNNDDDDDHHNSNKNNNNKNNNNNNNNDTLDLILLLILAGLCCCCCCCNFCQPRKLINKAKTYTAINPPGVLVEEGTEKHHEPTAEEIRAYRELLRHTQKL
jgi:hypothetical protein